MRYNFTRANNRILMSAQPNDMETTIKKKKTRLIVKSDCENIALSIVDIALVYTVERSVCIMDKFSKSYFLNKSLSEMQQELDDNCFFRANRQQMININFVKGFRAFENVKLQIELTLSGQYPGIIISKETAPLFKKWLVES